MDTYEEEYRVRLEFSLDEDILNEERDMDLLEVDAGVLLHIYFQMPVRLKIGSAELLQIDRVDQEQTQADSLSDVSAMLIKEKVSQNVSVWQSLPLLHIAEAGLDSVREAWSNGRSTYSIPGSGHIYLERLCEDIVVRSDLTEQISQCLYSELFTVFEQFRELVRATLLREVPQLVDHYYWGKWLKGDEVE